MYSVTFICSVRWEYSSKIERYFEFLFLKGFIFSEDEPMALLQKEGGPCAIIAPLQAFILKNLLFGDEPKEHWRQTEGTFNSCFGWSLLLKITERK